MHLFPWLHLFGRLVPVVTPGYGENAKLEVEGARLSAVKGVCEVVKAHDHQIFKHVAQYSCLSF